MSDDEENNSSTEILRCGICKLRFNESRRQIESITLSCSHEHHHSCWTKMFTDEEERLNVKNSRFHNWLH